MSCSRIACFAEHIPRIIERGNCFPKPIFLLYKIPSKALKLLLEDPGSRSESTLFENKLSLRYCSIDYLYFHDPMKPIKSKISFAFLHISFTLFTLLFINHAFSA